MKTPIINRISGGMPGPATPEQAEAVVPDWRKFLLPLLSPVGARAALGRATATVTPFFGPDGEPLQGEALLERRRKYAVKQAERYGTWIRPLAKKPPHPYVESVWVFAEALRFSKHYWAAGPLVLFAAGWLRPFIVTVATADRHKISRERLLEMLLALPDAIDGDAEARKTWIPTGVERDAFQSPKDVKGRFLLPKSGPLALAYALSEHFEIDYRELRHNVLACLDAWVGGLEWNA